MNPDAEKCPDELGTKICSFSKTYGTWPKDRTTGKGWVKPALTLKFGRLKVLKMTKSRQLWAAAKHLGEECPCPDAKKNTFGRSHSITTKKRARNLPSIHLPNPVTSITMNSSEKSTPDDPCLTSPSRAAHTNHLRQCPHSALALRRRPVGSSGGYSSNIIHQFRWEMMWGSGSGTWKLIVEKYLYFLVS